MLGGGAGRLENLLHHHDVDCSAQRGSVDLGEGIVRAHDQAARPHEESSHLAVASLSLSSASKHDMKEKMILT